VLNWAPSLLVAGALAWTLIGGQCALCPDTQATQASQHDCCKHNRDSHRGQTDSRDSHDKQCPGHGPVFESYGKAEIAPPAAMQAFLPAAALHEAVSTRTPGDTAALRHPPPGLCLQNSVLLI